MKIIRVAYSALFSLSNYNNERINLVANLQDGESPEEVIEKLKEKVWQAGGENAKEIYEAIRERQYALREIEEKLSKATERWNATADFLRKQGIKPDAPHLPSFENLLPHVEEEVIQGEIDDDDEEDDDD